MIAGCALEGWGAGLELKYKLLKKERDQLNDGANAAPETETDYCLRQAPNAGYFLRWRQEIMPSPLPSVELNFDSRKEKWWPLKKKEFIISCKFNRLDKRRPDWTMCSEFDKSG